MEWNTAKKIWQHSTDAHLFALWAPWLETWPTSGMTVNGRVYELPTPERHTTDSESLSSHTLPTPTATDYKGGNMHEDAAYGWEKRGWSSPNLSEGVARVFVESRLPTPTTQDGKNNGGPSQFDRNTPPLNTQVLMLPTTRTSMKNGATKKELDAGNPKFRLETVTDWGKYQPAIQRWEEVLDRPAPPPTKPDGKEGAHRLSSAFTEWLMGLPEGWVTDVGLTRNEELKACGNGVVPQQAATALRALLHGLPIASGGASELPNSDR